MGALGGGNWHNPTMLNGHVQMGRRGLGLRVVESGEDVDQVQTFRWARILMKAAGYFCHFSVLDHGHPSFSDQSYVSRRLSGDLTGG